LFEKVGDFWYVLCTLLKYLQYQMLAYERKNAQFKTIFDTRKYYNIIIEFFKFK